MKKRGRCDEGEEKKESETENNNNADEGEAGGEAREEGKEGRKVGRRRLCESVTHSGYMKEQNTTTQSTGGTQQGHRDMCLFDDKEIKHEKEIKETLLNTSFVLFI